MNLIITIFAACAVFAAVSKAVFWKRISNWKSLAWGSVIGGIANVVFDIVINEGLAIYPIISFLSDFSANFILIIFISKMLEGFYIGNYLRALAAAFMISVLNFIIFI